MVFSSLLFLFRFMPIAFILYYITPKNLKNFILFALSIFFYAWGEVKYLPVLLASVVVDFFMSNLIDRNKDRPKRCKCLLAVSMCTNIGLLAFFKYADFFISNMNGIFGTEVPFLGLSLPLGISFYTFQTMSYTIDVYRGKVEAEKNFIDFGAFVALFPQLIAGPIVRYTDVSRELKDRRVGMAELQQGIELFILGLGSKVLIANSIGKLWSDIEAGGFDGISMPLAWLGILAFTFQIYFDFSGYSLMAIGLGRMLGFQFPQNFNYPYISKSMTEFWRRWHMTLGSWFREYLYFPLGGSRKGTWRTFFNLFVVWGATGLWHGASWNFVLWGLFFFVLISIEKAGLGKHLEAHRVWARIYFIPLTLIGWSIFAITDFSQLGLFFGKLFSTDGIGAAGGLGEFLYYLKSYGITLIAAGVFSTPVLKPVWERIRTKRWLSTAMLMVMFGLSVAYIVDSTYNPFLYFRF